VKSRRAKRPEPRTALIGLNLTDVDLAQLDTLFAALKDASSSKRKARPFTRSTLAYQCFQTGLEHRLQGKPHPSPERYTPLTWDAYRSRPKRDAKLVGIYLSQTDFKNLIKFDSALDLRFFGRSFLRGEKRYPFQFNKRTPLAYDCFQIGLSVMLKEHSSGPRHKSLRLRDTSAVFGERHTSTTAQN
jgi:hypothetical protein